VSQPIRVTIPAAGLYLSATFRSDAVIWVAKRRSNVYGLIIKADKMTVDSPLLLQFRPRARIIRTIGDQLISGPEAAVIELVKNAYDADASFVAIKFTPPLTQGNGRISIRDDGHGMTLSDVQNKWMEPAFSAKSARRASPVRQRAMMGSKGIGRFAAAKLGRTMALTSISDGDGERRAVLIPEIDWSIFDSDSYLSDIKLEYLSQLSDQQVGTEIEVRELNETWSLLKLNKLHLELRRLISPLDRDSREDEFKIYLDLSLCTPETCGFSGDSLVNISFSNGREDGQGTSWNDFEVRPFPLLTACDYEVVGEFDESGEFSGTMQIRRAGQAPIPLQFNVIEYPDEQPCGKVGIQFFLFDRETNILKDNLSRAGMGDLTASEARRILDEISGIAIYRDGFRVRPYGDSANDWLTLDKRRVQNPSLRIGHNQIAGYITVAGQGTSGLEERSSREGFEENGPFLRLQRLVLTLLAQEIEPRRQSFREKAGLSRRKSTTFDEVRQLSELAKIRALIVGLPEKERIEASTVIDQQAALLTSKIDALEERQRVLEAKSSLGAIIGEVLHEGAPAVGYLQTTSIRLQRYYPSLFDNSDQTAVAKRDFPKKLHLIKENSQKLAHLFGSLRPLSGGKRGALTHFRPVDQIASAVEIFSTHNIEITIHDGLNAPEVMGYREDLGTAMVNLLSNAIYWLENSQTENPRIDIRLQQHGNELLIYVDDNGPGISSEFAESVFEVGFTLKDGGTGLGLNIAREALARSGATLGLHLDFEPGARFEIKYQL
jgi:signal transduction histidine kinase